MFRIDTASANAMLKEYYSNQRVETLSYKDAPLFALLTKVNDFYGELYPLPVRVTNSQGRSNTFSNAKAQKKSSVYRTFHLTRVSDYSLASIGTEQMLASENSAGAFLKLATAEIDGAMDSLKRSISWSLYGNGSGSLGTVIEPTGAVNTIALQSADDVVKFEVGQTIEVRSGATVRLWDTGVTSAVITKVNRSTGVITTDKTYSTANGTMLDGDTVNVVGDYNTKISGLAAWLPANDPTTGDSFFNVDRSIDPTRLAGVRVASSGKSLDEALIDAARLGNREGGSPSHAFMSFTQYARLEKSLGARVRYADVSVGKVAKISFKGIELSGPNGSIVCLPDRDCPANRIYLLDLETWALYSLKEPMLLNDFDGRPMLREADDDAFEVRINSYCQLGCKRPGSNVVMTF